MNKPSFYFSGEPNPHIRFTPYRAEVGVHTKRPGANSKSSNEEIYTRAIATNLPDYAALIANEVADKEPFLVELNALLRKEGHPVDVKQLFTQLAEQGGKMGVNGVASSQNMLVFRDFSDELGEGKSETTTPYRFHYGFFRKEAFGRVHIIPVTERDSRAWDVFARHDVPDALQQQFHRDEMTQRARSSHDYLHQLIEPARDHSPHAFFIAEQDPLDFDKAVTRNEFYLMALQATLWKQRFDHAPGLQEATLQHVAQTVHQIGVMERMALAHARGPRDIADIENAATYLAEPLAHSIFRVFEPKGCALQQAVMIKDETGVQIETSVAAEFDRIAMRTPAGVMAKTQTPESAKGFERVQAACRDWLGETYTQIHHVTKMPLYTLARPWGTYQTLPDFREVPKQQLSLASIVGRLAETVPMCEMARNK